MLKWAQWFVNNNIMVFSGSKRENSLLYVSKETNAFCDVDYLDNTLF